MMRLIWGAAGITSLGKYLIIGVTALFAMGWMVNGITAPYRRDIDRLETHITELKLAAKKRAQLEEADRIRAEADAAELARMEATLDSFIHESRTAPTACRIGPADLERLHVLANDGKR